MSGQSIGTIISVVCGIIVLVIIIGYMIPSNNERMESAQKDLDEARQSLDALVNKAIIHCQTGGSGCDVTMPVQLEHCKKPEYEHIPSCHDGRIEDYLRMNDIPTKITSATSFTDTRINQLAIRLINVCTELQTEENEIIASGQAYDDSEEFQNYWHSLNEQTNSCRESINTLKTDCNSKKNTNDYYDACDDPRLKNWYFYP